MAPSTNVAKTLDPGTPMYEQAKFYSTCQGYNPLQTLIGRSYKTRDAIGIELNLLFNRDFEYDPVYKNFSFINGSNPVSLNNHHYLLELNLTYFTTFFTVFIFVFQSMFRVKTILT
jgi:hypothetical protein